MGCLGCNLIELQAVSLIDGRTVCNTCPDWRIECEAREVLRMPLEARREYLEGVEGKRGTAACDLLKEAIKAQWQLSRS